MSHLKCTLPNASKRINGIDFEAARGGLVSVEPLTDEQLALFAGIPGYEIIPDGGSGAVVSVEGNDTGSTDNDTGNDGVPADDEPAPTPKATVAKKK